MTRLGLLGGTFDPPHYGHLLIAQEAAWQLQLDQVLFVPARQNPLKKGEPISGPRVRCTMVELAVADNPRFALSTRDLDRPGPSFTVDLLRGLQDEGADRELFFLVGGDILPELPLWYAPAAILQLARLVVMNRPGAPLPDLAALERSLPGVAKRIDVVRTPALAISSTELRARVRSGQPIRYLTPPAVEAYIVEQQLYQR